MNTSIFKAIGPIMIGPSSSHTAGAAKLAYTARLIVKKPFDHVSFGLHGSFAQTYKGHGTDRALVAGSLGISEDDNRLSNSFELAKKEGITYDFNEIILEGMHENSVKITFTLKDGTQEYVIGSSVGGGMILITNINGFETEFSAQSTTIVISQRDEYGIVNKITSVLAKNRINIGVMRLSRTNKGGTAFCVIETDDIIPEELKAELMKLDQIISVRVINI